MSEHNPTVTPATELTLSAVARTNRNAARGELRRIARCGHALPAGARAHARWCSDSCRQRAYRVRAGQRSTPAVEPLLMGSGGVDERAQNRESERARRHARPIVARPGAQGAHAVDAPHDHSPRLCPTCMQARALELRRAPRARVTAELVARRIAADDGDVWGAVVEYGISYSRALEIRAGERGAGRRAPRIPSRSRGWTNGKRNGWSTLDPVPELEVLDGGADRTRFPRIGVELRRRGVSSSGDPQARA